MTLLFENLPMQLNLSMPYDARDVIGWAKAEKNEDDTIKIEIVIRNPEGVGKLENLAEVFDLRSIGFAGIKRTPRDDSPA